jgi:hypothetical protein
VQIRGFNRVTIQVNFSQVKIFCESGDAFVSEDQIHHDPFPIPVITVIAIRGWHAVGRWWCPKA